MKKFKLSIAAILLAAFEVVAFYGIMPLHIAIHMLEYRTWNLVNVTKFCVKSAAHTIIDDFKEWYR